MNLHERFQTHCRFCFKRFEADTELEVLTAATDHEWEKHYTWLTRRPATADDFYER